MAAGRYIYGERLSSTAWAWGRKCDFGRGDTKLISTDQPASAWRGKSIRGGEGRCWSCNRRIGLLSRNLILLCDLRIRLYFSLGLWRKRKQILLISVNFSLLQAWLGWWSHQLCWQPALLSTPFTSLSLPSPQDSMQGGLRIWKTNIAQFLKKKHQIQKHALTSGLGTWWVHISS